MRNSSLCTLLALGALSALSLVVAAGCPARNSGDGNSSGRREPDILAAVGDDEAGPPSGPRKEKSKPAPFDPIFQGWPKPDVAILITGRQDGYLEPCGCAGLENQKGGLSRRHSLIKQLTADGWPLVPVDVGGLVRRFGKQAEIQFDISADALKIMGYRAVGFSADDLRLSAGEIAAAVAGENPDDTIFVSANVSLFGKDSGITPRYRIVQAGKFKIGITSILGAEFQKQVNNADVVFEPAARAIADVLPKLKNCDVKILLAHATLEETEALARRFPAFDLVVTAGGPDGEPPNQSKIIAGTKSRLVEVGEKGMYVAVVGLYGGPQKKSMRYQRVPLDSRFVASREMKQVMRNYQEQLQALGWEGLELKPTAHSQGEFAGAAACKECHKPAWEVWHKSKHAEATDTLVNLDPPRHFDAECVACHVTGWNAKEFLPYKSGYLSREETPKMVGNGCENCHGPAASHVAAEAGQNEALKETLRALVHLPTPTYGNKTCMKCHDLDNSPEFKADKFDWYWEQIAH